MTPFLLLCGRMTDEMREAFVGMGSTLIKSVKHRDSWVFAGRVGTENKSLHERVSHPCSLQIHFIPCVTSILKYAESTKRHDKWWQNKYLLLCSPVSKLLTMRKPTLMKDGRGLWRWAAVSPRPNWPTINLTDLCDEKETMVEAALTGLLQTALYKWWPL